MKNSIVQKNNQYPFTIRSIILTLFLLLNVIVATAQSSSISGVIFDQNCEPILFGNIVLKNVVDQTIYTVELSDEHGFFRCSDITPGNYQIEVSYNGVPLYCTNEFEHTNQPKNLPVLIVDHFTNDMMVATVTAKRINKENYLASSF